MPQLSVTRINTLRTPGRYGDGNGLYLRITPTGTKSWVQRIVVNGRRRDLGLGSYPAVSLAEARRKAAANSSEVAAGQDPAAKKEPQVRLPTFKEAAKGYFETHSSSWRSTRQTANWWSRLDRHAFPHIGNLPIDQVTPSHIIDMLLLIWTSHPETARKVRQHVYNVFRWSIARGDLRSNPADDSIRGGLPAVRRTVTHHKALPYDQVPEALRRIDATNAHPSSKLCFRFLVLTAARSGEARGATWPEIITDNAEWRIPPHRMKAAFLHRVPLSQPALKILEEAASLANHTDLLFPSPHGKTLSDSTLSKLLRENGIPAVPHGFRSSFRDWASENTNASFDCMELCLAHRPRSATEQAYARSDLFAQRRELMEAWADYLTQ